MFQPAEIAPWKLKSPPKFRKSHYRSLGGDFAHVEDH